MTPRERRPRLLLRLAASVATSTIALCLSAQAAEVTYQRLLNSANEPQNWLMRAGNYSNWNHSKLTEINRSNVANLKMKFMFAMSDPTRPPKAAQYFTPIVEDGFMYVGNQYHQYWKLDVREGKPKVVWKFDTKTQAGERSAHSVTLFGNNVYIAMNSNTTNPRLIALDKDSGQTVFDVPLAIPGTPNQGSSGAPLAIKDRIIIGTSGRNESGRGYVTAYSAKDGKQMW